MRELSIPTIEAPERFFPDPVLVQKPVYRAFPDGRGEFQYPRSGRWTPLHPLFIAILGLLEEGLTWEQLYQRLPTYPEQQINKKAAGKLARKFCWRLHELGVVRFDLEGPPEVFHGRYERIKELGRGGLGIAHLCRDRENGGTQVVVKHPWGVKSPIASGQRALAMEIAVMNEVHHPLVPRLHDTFTDRGLLHIVRDFVDGEKLQSSASRERLKDHAFRNRCFRQITEGLHAIHTAGYLFFDPSPDNFFLVGDQVVAADIGGSKPHTNGLIKGRGAGTPGYVARELRDSGHPRAGWPSVQSDIWSVGCLYYFFIVGRRPKRAWFHDEIMASLDGLDIRPVDRGIIDACTRDDPAERPRDMLEVRDLFED